MSREHLTTASHPQYLPAVNQTMITVYLDGDVRVRHGEQVTVTVKEGSGERATPTPAAIKAEQTEHLRRYYA